MDLSDGGVTAVTNALVEWRNVRYSSSETGDFMSKSRGQRIPWEIRRARHAVIRTGRAAASAAIGRSTDRPVAGHGLRNLPIFSAEVANQVVLRSAGHRTSIHAWENATARRSMTHCCPTGRR